MFYNRGYRGGKWSPAKASNLCTLEIFKIYYSTANIATAALTV